jgi:phage shock protein E
MNRRWLILGLLPLSLISLVLNNSCAAAMPASTTPASPIVTPPSVLPSSIPRTNTTSVSSVVVPTMSVEDAHDLIQNNLDNPNFIIIDVRTADEFSGGQLTNAVDLDYYAPNFVSNVDKLDQNKKYLVYCQTGIRGAAATQILLDLGHTRVYNLMGGIVQWINAGYSTSK